MSAPGTPVNVGDVLAPARPATELERLAEYIADRFVPQQQALIALNARSSQLKFKGDLVTLGHYANMFVAEVGNWLSIAERLLTEALSDEYDDARTEYSSDGQRALADQVKQRAKRHTAHLTEIVNLLQRAEKWAYTTISLVQSDQKAIRDDEFGELFATNNEVPEQMYQAPIGAALRRTLAA